MKKINYSGRVFDNKEKEYLLKAVDDMWLTYGKYSKEFETKLANFIGTKYCHFVNSGSSANLLAFMTLTSPLLGDRQIKRGDEVITTALCFPTTLAPIIQYGAVPVFIDVYGNYPNAMVYYLYKALTSKTKAVFLAHTLGMPFEIDVIKSFCKKNNLWLIEDNADALGSQFVDFDNKGVWANTGSFGDISTTSFYPAHMITTGQGGAAFTSNPLLNKIMHSMKDWGRDCSCLPGEDNKCGKRFSQKFRNLSEGYDHRYVYSHLGYNLAATDLQAAIGLAQLEKLPEFIKKRRENFLYLNHLLRNCENIFTPMETEHSFPCWFSYVIKLLPTASFTRNEMVQYLESEGIQTRVLFAGNITKQPCFDYLLEGIDYRVLTDINGLEVLHNTNEWMNNSFFIGIYPKLEKDDIEYMAEKIISFEGN